MAVAVAGSYSSDLTPSLGISICGRCSPKKKKKKKKKKERESEREKKWPCVNLAAFLVTKGPNRNQMLPLVLFFSD